MNEASERVQPQQLEWKRRQKRNNKNNSISSSSSIQITAQRQRYVTKGSLQTCLLRRSLNRTCFANTNKRTNERANKHRKNTKQTKLSLALFLVFLLLLLVREIVQQKNSLPLALGVLNSHYFSYWCLFFISFLFNIFLCVLGVAVYNIRWLTLKFSSLSLEKIEFLVFSL